MSTTVHRRVGFPTGHQKAVPQKGRSGRGRMTIPLDAVGLRNTPKNVAKWHLSWGWTHSRIVQDEHMTYVDIQHIPLELQ